MKSPNKIPARKHPSQPKKSKKRFKCEVCQNSIDDVHFHSRESYHKQMWLYQYDNVKNSIDFISHDLAMDYDFEAAYFWKFSGNVDLTAEFQDRLEIEKAEYLIENSIGWFF